MLETSDRADRLELITRLKGNAAVAAAVEEIAEQRKAYYTNLGRTLLASNEPANQREIDFKRGVWMGAMWAYTGLLTKAESGLEREIDKALKAKEEGDA